MGKWTGLMTIRQNLGAVLAVAAMLGLLLAVPGQAQAGEHLLLQNPSTGQTGYFNLLNTGQASTTWNKTRAGDGYYGWDTLTKNAPTQNSQMKSDWRMIPGVTGHYTSDTDRSTRIFWQNDAGTTAWWKLNSNGVLGGSTAQSFDFVSNQWKSPGNLSPNPYKAFAAVNNKKYPTTATGTAPTNGSASVIFFHNTAAGQIGFYNVGSDGYLANITKGKGWDVSGTISGLTGSAGWQAAPFVLENVGPHTTIDTASKGQYDLLYFNNPTTGQAGYVRLNAMTGKILDAANPSVAPFSAVEYGKEQWAIVAKADNWVGIGGGDGKGWVPVDVTTPCTYAANGTITENNSCYGFAGVLSNTLKKNQLMFWHNTSTGKVAWWSLNTNGLPKVIGGANGTDFGIVEPTSNADFLLKTHKAVGLHENVTQTAGALGDRNHLIFQNTSTGQNFWWSLDSKATLANRTENNNYGYGYYYKDLPAAWRLIGVEKFQYGKMPYRATAD